VEKGEILGEIVDIGDPDELRVPVISKTSGVIFSMARHKLVRPAEVNIFIYVYAYMGIYLYVYVDIYIYIYMHMYKYIHESLICTYM
jgi:hypothetical protein